MSALDCIVGNLVGQYGSHPAPVKAGPFGSEVQGAAPLFVRANGILETEHIVAVVRCPNVSLVCAYICILPEPPYVACLV
jgi:hypothetical protein